ncbi:MAG: hypothetical protein ABSC95_00400 [Acetobacteraceae bacterium]
MPQVAENIVTEAVPDPHTDGVTLVRASGATTASSFDHRIGSGVFSALADPTVFAPAGTSGNLAIDSTLIKVHRTAGSLIMQSIVLWLFALLFLLTGLPHPTMAQPATPGTVSHRLPGLAWFGPSDWYPYVVKMIDGKEVRVPGTGPNGINNQLSFTLQGDYNAMFLPGAAWDPSDVGMLVIGNVDVMPNVNPAGKALLDWSKAHPQVKIGFYANSLTIGPDSGCVSSGTYGYPVKGTRLTQSTEGLFYNDRTDFPYPTYNYPLSDWNGIQIWKNWGGRIDVILFDTPLTAGINRCNFTIPRTVSFMLGYVRKILSVYPDVQFSIEQGPVFWTDDQWINAYSLPFFREFARQTNKPISYVNLDMHLSGDVRKPPTPAFTSIAAATQAFAAAGVKVGLYIVANAPAPGQTQAQYLAEMNGFMQQAINLGIPLDHLLVDPYSAYHNPNWVLNNLPESSPSAVTSLLPHSH